jgi:hypothetical protein
LVFASLVVLTLTRLACESCPALDPWDWPAAWRDLDQAQQRLAELETAFVATDQRHQAKMAIVAQLAAGQCSLEVAVARVQDVCRDSPHLVEAVRWQDPFGGPVEACLARHVISWACIRLEGQPARRAEVIARLEGELRAYLGPR